MLVCLILAGGCGAFWDGLVGPEASLFSVPLEIDGESVGPAVIDTGGGFEVMLRDEYGLSLVDEAEVLAFRGVEPVAITEGFVYSAGGFPAQADFAIVGSQICDCNGLGYHFFRKTGVVLGLDFSSPTATFDASVPAGGETILFALPPTDLESFESAFIDVDVSAGGVTKRARALLDTGAPVTAMRRGFAGSPGLLTPDRATVQIAHARLGALAVHTVLFDTPGLPDVILGLDAMRAWGERWHFSFIPGAGTVTVFPYETEPPVEEETVSSALSSPPR